MHSLEIERICNMLINFFDWHTQFYGKTLFAIQSWYKIYDWKITIVEIEGCIGSIKKPYCAFRIVTGLLYCIFIKVSIVILAYW